MVCASTGNTSVAAYASCCFAKIAMGKLTQTLIYGFRIVPIEGNFDDALNMVRALGEQPKVESASTRSASRDKRPPRSRLATFSCADFHFGRQHHPYWKGFKKYHTNGKVRNLQKMVSWQAAGSDCRQSCGR